MSYTERIDKLICNNSEYSRSEIKKLIKKGVILLNGNVVSSPEIKAENSDRITINGTDITIRQHVYLMLNKPKGYVSSTKDKLSKTVLDLIPDCYSGKNLFPAGRLDKDTTGFMLITDDGDFAHNILSPKNHVPKVYIATLDTPVTDQMIEGFKNGVTLFDGTLCMRALLEKVPENSYKAKVTLKEGMYHQIKRMFGVYGAGVNELCRIQIGSLRLDDSLPEGKCKELSSSDLAKITKTI